MFSSYMSKMSLREMSRLADMADAGERRKGRDIHMKNKEIAKNFK